MSGINAAAPDPAQELGAEDEVTAFNNEEEGEYEGDESLNDIKSELQLEADSDKAKVRACLRTCVRTCALDPLMCCERPVQLVVHLLAVFCLLLLQASPGHPQATVGELLVMQKHLSGHYNQCTSSLYPVVTAQAFPVNQPTFLVCCTDLFSLYPWYAVVVYYPSQAC